MYALAKIDLRENQPARALKLLERAVTLAPEQPAIHFLLGRTCQALGMKERAQKAFQEVRRLHAASMERHRKALETELPLETERP